MLLGSRPDPDAGTRAFTGVSDSVQINLPTGRLYATGAQARECLQYHPHCVSAVEALVLSLRYRRAYTEAIEVVQQALLKCPQAASLHHQLGLLHKDSGEFNAA